MSGNGVMCEFSHLIFENESYHETQGLQGQKSTEHTEELQGRGGREREKT